MTNDELTESLLEKICYVIDILPNQIADFERYSEIEEYYIPVYTLLGGEEDEEDYDEDDGRYDA